MLVLPVVDLAAQIGEDFNNGLDQPTIDTLEHRSFLAFAKTISVLTPKSLAGRPLPPRKNWAILAGFPTHEATILAIDDVFICDSVRHKFQRYDKATKESPQLSIDPIYRRVFLPSKTPGFRRLMTAHITLIDESELQSYKLDVYFLFNGIDSVNVVRTLTDMSASADAESVQLQPIVLDGDTEGEGKTGQRGKGVRHRELR